MELIDIVCKLIGPVYPVGKTETDDTRFESLKIMCDLVDKLVTKIDTVSYENSNSVEYSRKRAADYAKKYLTETLGIIE